MSAILAFLNNGWVGIIVGTGVGYALYLKSLRLPEPRIMFNSEHTITWHESDSLPPGIKVTFKEKNVPRVARSVVRIWNNGKGCLTSEMVSGQDNLRFALENDGEFLTVILLKQSNPACRCELKIDDSQKEVHISFDFLNQNDGMVIGLLHTDINAKPLLKGSMKGCAFKETGYDGRKIVINKYRMRKTIRIMAASMLVIGVTLIGMSLLSQDQLQTVFALFDDGTRPPPLPDYHLARTFMILIGITYAWLGYSYYWKRRRLYPKSLMKTD